MTRFGLIQRSTATRKCSLVLRFRLGQVNMASPAGDFETFLGQNNDFHALACCFHCISTKMDSYFNTLPRILAKIPLQLEEIQRQQRGMEFSFDVAAHAYLGRYYSNKSS